MAKTKIQTGLEFAVQMKDFLGDDRMEDYINQRFAHVSPEGRKRVIHTINRVHAAKPKERPQIAPTKLERKPRTDKYRI